jgi:hypothetical protein
MREGDQVRLPSARVRKVPRARVQTVVNSIQSPLSARSLGAFSGGLLPRDG